MESGVPDPKELLELLARATVFAEGMHALGDKLRAYADGQQMVSTRLHAMRQAYGDQRGAQLSLEALDLLLPGSPDGIGARLARHADDQVTSHDREFERHMVEVDLLINDVDRRLDAQRKAIARLDELLRQREP